MADNTNIRLLFCAVGLDALLMAGEAKVFEQRLCNFLGEGSFVLPILDDGRQPGLRVADVARDVYTSRNYIAHGRKTPEEYKAAYILRSTSGEPLTRMLDAPRYGQILEECALSLLCSALKRVFALNLLETVQHERRWRQHLEKKNKQ